MVWVWMEGRWCGIEGVVWMEGGVGCGWMAGGGGVDGGGVDGCGVGVDGGAVVWDEVYGGRLAGTQKPPIRSYPEFLMRCRLSKPAANG